MPHHWVVLGLVSWSGRKMVLFVDYGNKGKKPEGEKQRPNMTSHFVKWGYQKASSAKSTEGGGGGKKVPGIISPEGRERK